MIQKFLPTSNADFVVIGDVLIDNILALPEKLLEHHPRKGTLEIPFPTKIPLDTAPTSIPGGNAYTVAMVLAKLGLNVQIYTIVGDDDAGRRIVNKLSSLDVGINLVEVRKNEKTNSSIILSADHDRVIFSYHYDRKYLLPELPKAKYVYLTSVGENDEPLYTELLKQKKQIGFELIFSPGSRQLKEPYSEIEPIMKQTSLLLLNRDEAVRITKLTKASDAELVQALQKLGPKQVVMTKSSQGSVGLTGDEVLKVGALQVKTVETTGAGDTFSASVSAAIAYGEGLLTAMEWGAFNSGSVVQYVGCEEGALSKNQLLEQHRSMRSKLVFTE